MKYVVTMTDGKYVTPPILISDWLIDNSDSVDPAEAMSAWLFNKPFIVGGGASLHFVNFLVDLPA